MIQLWSSNASLVFPRWLLLAALVGCHNKAEGDECNMDVQCPDHMRCDGCEEFGGYGKICMGYADTFCEGWETLEYGCYGQDYDAYRSSICASSDGDGGSGCDSYDGPTADVQRDSFCQAAWSASCAGEDSSAYCDTYNEASWGSAGSCPYC